MVNIQNLRFGYGKKKILFDQLSLQLQEGHIYGLLGENGAGKSTLLKLMSGLVFAQGGNLATLGRNPKERSPLMLQKIAFIPEEFELPSCSIAHYLRTMTPFYPQFDSSYFDRLMQDFHIPQEQDLTDMSYGQKKKFVISFGLATNAQLILMDEPTNGLDIPSKAQFRKIIAAALTEERTIIISTHQVRDLDNLIDTVIILDEHKIVLNATTDTITETLLFLTDTQLKENALYTENNFNQYNMILPNERKTANRLDMEILFNAVLLAKSNITQLFK